MTRAAERVGIGQPAMSLALRRLRVALSDPILVRVGKESFLTPFAEELESSVDEVLRIVDVISNRKTFDPNKDERSFRVAASDYSTVTIIAPLMANLFKEAPGISIEIVRPDDDHGRFTQLISGDLDLLLFPSGGGPQLPSEVVSKDEWVCAVWEHHSAVRETVTMDDFFSLPRLSYSNMTEPRPEGCDRDNPKTKMIAHSFMSLPFLLKGSCLLTVIPRRLGEKLRTISEIRLLPLPFETPEIAESMFWHPRSTADPAHAWLRGRIAEEGRRKIQFEQGHQNGPGRQPKSGAPLSNGSQARASAVVATAASVPS